jgi:hypothetical protein
MSLGKIEEAPDIHPGLRMTIARLHSDPYKSHLPIQATQNIDKMDAMKNVPKRSKTFHATRGAAKTRVYDASVPCMFQLFGL